jgi:endonuclease/exonuclease/phosphatase (EEP) superfamily protein YafD
MQLFLNSLEELISSNISNDEEIILLGDFNINLLQASSEQVKLNDIVTAYRFRLLNEIEPTRKFNNSTSLIDHIYCNFDCVTMSSVEDIAFSDHRVVLCNFNISSKLPRDKWVFQ